MESLKKNKQNLDDLIKFSFDIYFNPFPSEIDITNPYPCTPTELRNCKVSDSTSCFGCQNLIAKCVHFEADTKYTDLEGHVTLLPKNETEDDGYCLVVDKLVDRCNLYHGDLVLVQLTPDSGESALTCSCKNPGYIGNTELNGACDTVFVCGGQIDNIDQPIENIKCVCDEGYTSTRAEDSTPVCKPSIVLDYDFTNYTFGLPTIDISNFDSTISGNIKANKLVNPCKVCAITGKPANGQLVESEDGFQCIASDYSCIPIRRSLTERILKGNNGPDGVVNIKIQEIDVLGYISSVDFRNINVHFLKDQNEEICNLLNLTEDHYILNMYPHQVVFPGSFNTNPQIATTVTFKCSGSWPGYNCGMTQNTDANNSYVGNILYKRYGGRSVPGSFLWGTEQWETVEGFNAVFDVKDIKNKLYDITIKGDLRGTSSESKLVKFLYLNFRIVDNQLYTYIIRANNESDYEGFRNLLINKE